MRDIELFRNELAYIKNDNYRNFTHYALGCAPAYFWECGASSSGKYHPCFSQGEGGLVRHTKAVVRFCDELLRMSSYAYMKDEYKDFAFMACILHDICKYGAGDEMNKDEYKEHGANAAKFVGEIWKEYFGQSTEAPFLLLNAIRSHMGQWTPEKEDRPFTQIDRLVHLSDYIASRSFIDIPEITSEYQEEVEAFTSEIPF